MTVAQQEQQHDQQQHTVPSSPLNVKEQIEASATRFWSSVKQLSIEDAMNDTNKKTSDTGGGAFKVPGVPVGLFSTGNCTMGGGLQQSISSSDEDPKKTPSTPQNPLQFVVNAMFSSCTSMGNHFDNDSSVGSVAGGPVKKNDSGKFSNPKMTRSRAVTALTSGTTITPSSSRGEGTATAEPITPSPLHQPKRPTVTARSSFQESSKNLFKNNHDIAEEAIKHLRQQQQRVNAQELINETNMYASEIAVDTERDPSQRSNIRTVSPIQRLQAHSQPSSQLSSLLQPISHRLKSKTVKNLNPSGVTPLRNRQEHTFFPASKPRDPPGTTRQEQRIREKQERIKGVPKEVTPSPPRTSARTKQKRGKSSSSGDHFFGATKGAAGDGIDDQDTNTSSWDLENDGISVITQNTVDRMVFAIGQQLRVFPEEADNLNRVHSDVTDPVPNQTTTGDNDADIQNNNNNTRNKNASSEKASSELFPMIGGAVAGFTLAATTLRTNTSNVVVTPTRGRDAPDSKGVMMSMPPSLFTRNVGSSGTRSFFTKTTYSTQTNDFANAWRLDEQNFWDSEVAKQSNEGNTNMNINNGLRSPDRRMNTKQQGVRGGKSRRSGATTGTAATSITTATTPTTQGTRSFAATSPSMMVHNKHEEHTSREVYLTDHDNLMDSWMLQNDFEMSEI